MIDVLGPEKRRRRTTQEKIAIVQQSFEPGMTVSLVARQHGVAASQLFLWRKQYQEGSLTAVAAGEQVVPASELAAAMKQIKELQRLLGKKTMENEHVCSSSASYVPFLGQHLICYDPFLSQELFPFILKVVLNPYSRMICAIFRVLFYLFLLF